MGELVRGRGHVPVRRRPARPASAAAAVVLAAASALGGCSGSGEAVGTASLPAATAVSCPTGEVNAGTPDGAAGSDGVADVREHAARWADATGFTKRFPQTRLSVGQSPDEAVARFVEQNRLRAQLTYSRTTDGWVLDALEYC